MAVKRENIKAGLVVSCNTMCINIIRPIIYIFDEDKNIGHDLINHGISYPMYNWKKSNKYDTCAIVSPTNLDSILESLGYPQTLNNEHFQDILGTDMNKIFIESNVLTKLYDLSSNEYFKELYLNSLQNNILTEFSANDQEMNYKVKRKKTIFK